MYILQVKGDRKLWPAVQLILFILSLDMHGQFQELRRAKRVMVLSFFFPGEVRGINCDQLQQSQVVNDVKEAVADFHPSIHPTAYRYTSGIETEGRRGVGGGVHPPKVYMGMQA